MTDNTRECLKEASARIVWSSPDDMQMDNVFVTPLGGIGVSIAGNVIVKPAREWHALASTPAPAQGGREDSRLRTALELIARDPGGIPGPRVFARDVLNENIILHPYGPEQGDMASELEKDGEINSLQRDSIWRLHDLIKHGAKIIDLRVRKDAQEYHFEADWLKQLLRRVLGHADQAERVAKANSPQPHKHT
jgi:hypothetical protein